MEEFKILNVELDNIIYLIRTLWSLNDSQILFLIPRAPRPWGRIPGHEKSCAGIETWRPNFLQIYLKNFGGFQEIKIIYIIQIYIQIIQIKQGENGLLLVNCIFLGGLRRSFDSVFKWVSNPLGKRIFLKRTFLSRFTWIIGKK